MRTFEQLRDWAKITGYVVERISRNRIEWYHNTNHSLIGECRTVKQVFHEIANDYWARRASESFREYERIVCINRMPIFRGKENV